MQGCNSAAGGACLRVQLGSRDATVLQGMQQCSRRCPAQGAKVQQGCNSAARDATGQVATVQQEVPGTGCNSAAGMQQCCKGCNSVAG
eukprot:1137833-Pelagomonas_calceolata.AAC.5